MGAEKFKEKLLEYTGPLPSKGEEPKDEWNAGYFYGIHDQKQEGLKFLGFNVPVGRLDAEEVFELARISETYGNGEVRTCNSQNLIIPNIPEENVEALLQEKIFERISIDPNSFIGHAVSCTGIEYCNLALVETKERMRLIAEELRSTYQPGCSDSHAHGRLPEFVRTKADWRYRLARNENA